ncbi:hypothetical protein [Bifidobacterium magnum]|uniref:Uncharacterized protein n=1 Tax=Bifidobacterium magnum TaxID=1692 RepID=A0A087B9P3_9BIFI|nr:hypothetical protein [Bifidobacterium magnum]KFI67743.1 hypothetical protein BMAGN_1553 [Bifidobacterium magnum]
MHDFDEVIELSEEQPEQPEEQPEEQSSEEPTEEEQLLADLKAMTVKTIVRYNDSKLFADGLYYISKYKANMIAENLTGILLARLAPTDPAPFDSKLSLYAHYMNVHESIVKILEDNDITCNKLEQVYLYRHEDVETMAAQVIETIQTENTL